MATTAATQAKFAGLRRHKAAVIGYALLALLVAGCDDSSRNEPPLIGGQRVPTRDPKITPFAEATRAPITVVPQATAVPASSATPARGTAAAPSATRRPATATPRPK